MPVGNSRRLHRGEDSGYLARGVHGSYLVSVSLYEDHAVFSIACSGGNPDLLAHRRVGFGRLPLGREDLVGLSPNVLARLILPAILDSLEAQASRTMP